MVWKKSFQGCKWKVLEKMPVKYVTQKMGLVWLGGG